HRGDCRTCHWCISVLQSGTSVARPEADFAGVGKADTLRPSGSGQSLGTSRRGSADRRYDRSGEDSVAIQSKRQSHHQVDCSEEAAAPKADKVTAGVAKATWRLGSVAPGPLNNRTQLTALRGFRRSHRIEALSLSSRIMSVATWIMINTTPLSHPALA